VEVPSFPFKDGELVPVNQMGVDALERTKNEKKAKAEALKPEKDPASPVIEAGTSLEKAKEAMQTHYKTLAERRSQRAGRLEENLKAVAGMQPTPGNEEAFEAGLVQQAKDIEAVKAQGAAFDEAEVGTATMSDGSRAVMTDGLVNGGGNIMAFENVDGKGLQKVENFGKTPTPESGLNPEARPYSFSGEVSGSTGQPKRIWRQGVQGEVAPRSQPGLPTEGQSQQKAPPPLVEDRAPVASLDQPFALEQYAGIQTRPTQIDVGPRTRIPGNPTSLSPKQIMSGEDPYHPDMDPARAARLLSRKDNETFRRRRNLNFSQLTSGEYAV